MRYSKKTTKKKQHEDKSEINKNLKKKEQESKEEWE